MWLLLIFTGFPVDESAWILSDLPAIQDTPFEWCARLLVLREECEWCYTHVMLTVDIMGKCML